MASTNDTPSREQQRAAARAHREAQEAAAARSSARTKRLGIVGGVAALAAVIVVLLLVLSSPGDEGGPTVTATAGESVAGQTATAELLDGIPQDGRTLGRASAPVTLVEFADVQCPFCAEFARNALPTVVRDYVRTGKVRLEFRPRTFLGEDSVKAAKLVVAAGRQDKLWNVLDLFYANQGPEGSGWVTDELATRVLRAADADPARVRSTADGAGVTRDLTDADLLATRNGLDSTPSFLVGKTGGKLAPLPVQELSGSFFARALDEAGA